MKMTVISLRVSTTLIRRRRGTVLIAVTWLLIVLTALAIILAHTVETEVSGSGNALSRAQADAIELGAEQYVLAQVDFNNSVNQGDPATITNMQSINVPCQAVQVGDGYFWIICPNFDDPQTPLFGIVDEAGKINLNVATVDVLQKLPGMSDSANTTIPASIIAWRGNGQPPAAGTTPAASTSQDGQYYAGMPSPYVVKNCAIESVDELALVKGIAVDPTAQLGQSLDAIDPLYGYDLNHNGILDAAELNGASNAINAAQDGSLGFANLVTVYSSEPSTDSTGAQRVNVNSGNTSQLNTMLQQYDPGRASAILQATTRGAPYANILDYYIRAQLTAADFALISDSIVVTPVAAGGTGRTGARTTNTATTSTITTNTPGLVNICTAPASVIACLPQLTDDDADALVSLRSNGVDLTNLAWVGDAVKSGTLTQAKALAIGGLITSRSYQYSADIVGVSGDGRAFKRVRIVVDTTYSPPKILYRKDLTSLGWPLDPAIQKSLRDGNGVPNGVSNNMKGGT